MKRQDLTNKIFNKLTVIKYEYTKENRAYWLCKCECGNYKIVSSHDLKNNSVKSCGCLKQKNNIKKDKIYYKLYNVWNTIKHRCCNPKRNSYKYYGLKGITLCNEWFIFENFYNWAIQNGYKDEVRGKYTIDRINNNGNYEPSNCRIVNMKKQCNNRCNNRFLIYNNETHTISEWANILNININTLHNRINNLKWDTEKALTKKVRKVCL